MKIKLPAFRLQGLTLMVLFLSKILTAQEVKPDLTAPKMYNNAVYGHVGAWIGEIWFTATGYYERRFQIKTVKKGEENLENTQNAKVSTFVRAGYGAVGYWEGGSQYILGHFGILTGAQKHHFEASAGFVKSISNAEFPLYPLSGSLAYRIQKPGGHFIFRTGLGWPEAIFAGIGASF